MIISSKKSLDDLTDADIREIAKGRNKAIAFWQLIPRWLWAGQDTTIEIIDGKMTVMKWAKRSNETIDITAMHPVELVARINAIILSAEG